MLARHEQPREHVVLHLAGGWLEWSVAGGWLAGWMDGWMESRVSRATRRCALHPNPRATPCAHLPSAAAAAAAAAAAPSSPSTPPAPSSPSASSASSASLPPPRLGLRLGGLRLLEEEDQRPAQQLVLHVIEPRRVRARR